MFHPDLRIRTSSLGWVSAKLAVQSMNAPELSATQASLSPAMEARLYVTKTPAFIVGAHKMMAHTNEFGEGGHDPMARGHLQVNTPEPASAASQSLPSTLQSTSMPDNAAYAVMKQLRLMAFALPAEPASKLEFDDEDLEKRPSRFAGQDVRPDDSLISLAILPVGAERGCTSAQTFVNLRRGLTHVPRHHRLQADDRLIALNVFGLGAEWPPDGYPGVTQASKCKQQQHWDVWSMRANATASWHAGDFKDKMRTYLRLHPAYLNDL
ncbi:hypothetical protein AK812_SmicGene28412 [Symbiodinium microadriaticum]|uniref:Uncharacterized protein n=1 Tax=Symbiodinium microadriaticum TaxID=2951 RepID=A0A1Q9D4E9_SYMMI|nr:hypothetical protein AK812_SmicGene28412 [Symbiodinium microadriaticum]CAE7722935.1 unnamed protein product [Symbiodinium microadriaticum]